MKNIKFCEPPPRARELVDHPGIAKQLRAQPNKWALIEDNAPSNNIAKGINSGNLNAYKPRGSFESLTRIVEGKMHIYARFVGEN